MIIFPEYLEAVGPRILKIVGSFEGWGGNKADMKYCHRQLEIDSINIDTLICFIFIVMKGIDGIYRGKVTRLSLYIHIS